MTLEHLRHWRIFCALAAAPLLVACGGGGGNGNGDTAANCEGEGAVAISGTVEYEFVPAVETQNGARLDYANSEFRPIRGAEVQARCANGSATYATTASDSNGRYSLEVPENVDVTIRVRAVMQQAGAPSWDFRVVDNTQGQAVWGAEGEAFDSGTGSVTANLRAASGWNGNGYAQSRAAAPFAILDSVYIAMQKVLEAEPDAKFPALKLNWSAKNTSDCSGTTFPFADGCIGTSFFADFGGGERNIFILGKEDLDTDEYDNHVIIHEWGHYYENAFSRSDSIGGAHGGGDALDPRVAFGEGWGNAFSAIATDDVLYVDTGGSDQSSGFWIDVESDFEGAHPGWWNESSVQNIIYDLYDAANDDAAALGFAPLHEALTNEQKVTEAVTSIFPLLHFLKTNDMADAGNIDAVAAAHGISLVNDEWGDNRGSADDGSEFGEAGALYNDSVHRDLDIITSGSLVTVCTTNALASESEYNRLGARRLLRFTAPEGDWQIRLEGDGVDPDFFVYASGIEVTNSRSASPDESGADDSSTDADGTIGVEMATVALHDGIQYVIEVMDWENLDDMDTTGGDICLDLTFTAN